MDALSDVLRVTRLTGGVFVDAEFFEPWCMLSELEADFYPPCLGPVSHLILYHYVVEGRLNVRVGNEPAFELGPGDVVIFPRNDQHLLGSHLDRRPVLGSDVVVESETGGLATIRLGGNGPRTHVICGFLGCDDSENNPVISLLPSSLRLRTGDGGNAEWIRATFQYAANEVATGGAGSETVMAKLSELLFIEAVRRYAESQQNEVTGWMAGLRDPYVARALALFHGRIDHSWTVEELGREVGLSRSALGDRFTRLIGQAPMHYLANWRMQVAAQSLRSSDDSLAQIAGRIGYESEAAFSRAFKKSFGSAPATWRRSRASIDR